MAKQRIFFEFSQQALHRYPEHPKLKKAHQHVFGFRLEVETKSDREIEFLEFRDKVKAKFLEPMLPSDVPSVMDFEDRSCETLAAELIDAARLILGDEWKKTNVTAMAKETEERAGAIVEDKL